MNKFWQNMQFFCQIRQTFTTQNFVTYGIKKHMYLLSQILHSDRWIWLMVMWGLLQWKMVSAAMETVMASNWYHGQRTSPRRLKDCNMGLLTSRT